MSDLRERLARLGLSQYHEVFTTEGFDTWETVLDITESDLCAHTPPLPGPTCAYCCVEVTSTSSLAIVGYVAILAVLSMPTTKRFVETSAGHRRIARAVF
jgi:hypothetical protein